MPPFDSINSFRGKHACLSLSVFSPFIWDGDWYNSAAAAFHASKLESRTARIPFIKYNCKPWRANQIGSQIREWDMRPNWHADSDKFLLEILRNKFHSREWGRRLLETGSAMLVDGNLHHDNRLGICECLRAAPSERKYGTSAACNGTGLNRHGHLLMQVRDELRVEAMLGAA
jgi:predicted NAD-dependent protein-ADP-ribosyltransferase YbiA (DUF1768 family)